MAQNLIECKKVNFYFTKERILYNVDWLIEKGDFWAIIGPNGGGKSTLARLLVGLLEPTSGQIVRHCSSIGYVPQNTFANRDFPITTQEVVEMGFLGGIPSVGALKDEQKAAAFRLLCDFGLESCAKRRIGELSGGQRQRALIARALCSNPQLLVLDEPTASLDERSVREIYELLARLNATKTIIMISHDISVLLGYAKRVLHVNKTVHIHNAPKVSPIVREDGHFCEVELVDLMQERKKYE